ncbi:hypothetical protein B5D77_02840 [Microcystis sp. MC19]|nr:hypothetical protein B5D77_02840 [Microcystis sp. MC19]
MSYQLSVISSQQKTPGSSRFCVISLTYTMIDQSLCPLCLCGSFHSVSRSERVATASRTVS